MRIAPYGETAYKTDHPKGTMAFDYLRQAETALSESVAGWFATDWMPLTEPVVVTGVSEVDDPGHETRYLDAPGQWPVGLRGIGRCRPTRPGETPDHRPRSDFWHGTP
jgi:hypothetical protein